MSRFTLGSTGHLAKDADCFESMAQVWNSACCKSHGFFPVTAELLKAHMTESRHWDPELVMIARDDETGRWLGFAHAVIVNEPYYPVCGSIEAVCVVPEARCKGIATALIGAGCVALRKKGMTRIDGGGSWPNCPLYATLIDGSERAGVATAEMAKVFAKNGFVPDRKSLRLRIAGNALFRLAALDLPEELKTTSFSRASETTWLDYCFRRWDLTEHHLCDASGQVLSRCITSPMRDASNLWGDLWYSIFAVFCAVAHRRKGYALSCLSYAARKVLEDGGKGLELHVLAENAPAIGLYTKAGFRKVGIASSMSLVLS